MIAASINPPRIRWRVVLSTAESLLDLFGIKVILFIFTVKGTTTSYLPQNFLLTRKIEMSFGGIDAIPEIIIESGTMLNTWAISKSTLEYFSLSASPAAIVPPW